MRVSDLIEEFIKDLFDENEYIEIQRNDLAQQFNCVPSQINYVISTRFKTIHKDIMWKAKEVVEDV